MAQVNRTARRRKGGKSEDRDFIMVLGPSAKERAGWLKVKVPNGRHPVTGKLEFKYAGPLPVDQIDELRRRRDVILAEQKKTATGTVKPGRAKRMSVREWNAHFLKHIVKPNQAARTYENYASVIRRHVDPMIGDVALVELTTTRLERWLGDLQAKGMSPSMVGFVLKRYKAVLQAAVGREETGLIGDRAVNQARPVRPPKKPASPKYVTDRGDTMRLVAAIGTDSYMAAMPLVATDLGLRRGEVSGLHWGDIDLDKATVTLNWHVVKLEEGSRRRLILPGTKTSEGLPYTLPLSARAVAALRVSRDRLIEHKLANKRWHGGRAQANTFYEDGRPYVIPQNPVADNAVVFPQSEGGVYEPNAMNSWFTTVVCKRAGVKKTMHNLRDDCATFLLTKKVSLAQVAEHMRHANPQITAKHYAHLLVDDTRLAANVFDEIGAEEAASAA